MLPANEAQFILELSDSKNHFQVLEFSGEEAISHPFYYRITLIGDEADLDITDFLEQRACLRLLEGTDDPHIRYIQGVVGAFAQLSPKGPHSCYQLTLVPPLALLEHRRRIRIYQNKTVQAICEQLFKEAGWSSSEYQFNLSGNDTAREYCTQYHESDRDFIERLLAEEGIHYHFEHSASGLTMICSDQQGAFATLPEPKTLPWVVASGTVPKGTSVQSFNTTTAVAPDRLRLRDYDFIHPSYTPEGEASEGSKGFGIDAYPGYPARFDAKDMGSERAKRTLRANAYGQLQAEGKSDSRLLCPGFLLSLTDHPNSNLNQSWLITHLKQKGSQPQVLEAYSGNEGGHFEVTFQVMPASDLYRPTIKKAALADGPEVAVVTGPSGEEIYCDEYGRIKVQFIWDREGQGDESSSCWMRVLQSWAGNGYGQFHLPRVGQEVQVAFENGDPSRPLVTGCMYNAANMPPYPLPDNKTRTVLRTQSSPDGTTNNEIRLEDKKGEEQFYLFAGRDHDTQVANRQREQVGEQKHLLVEEDQYRQTKGDEHIIVNGNRYRKVDGDDHHPIGGTQHIKINASLLLKSGSEIHLKAGQKAVMEAGSELTITAGGSFVKLDPGGVTLSGPSVSVNSGGSAGSGTGQSAKAAQQPETLDEDGNGEVCETKASESDQVEGLEQQNLNLQNLDFSQPQSSQGSTPATIAAAKMVGPTHTPELKNSLIKAAKKDDPLVTSCQKQPDGNCPLTNCPCREH